MFLIVPSISLNWFFKTGFPFSCVLLYVIVVLKRMSLGIKQVKYCCRIIDFNLLF